VLPFDGDQVLSVILPKMALLAADDERSGPVILRQLPRPEPSGSLFLGQDDCARCAVAESEWPA
jgi:hypothetical protein